MAAGQGAVSFDAIIQAGIASISRDDGRPSIWN